MASKPAMDGKPERQVRRTSKKNKTEEQKTETKLKPTKKNP